MGLYTKAFTANAYPSRAGVSGRYPVIPPVRLPVHRLISHGICLCADFLPPANKSHSPRTRPLLYLRPLCWRSAWWQALRCPSRHVHMRTVPIGKPLMLSPAFPPASTGHATFTASGAPSSIVSAVIHTHFFTLAKSVCYDLHWHFCQPCGNTQFVYLSNLCLIQFILLCQCSELYTVCCWDKFISGRW